MKIRALCLALLFATLDLAPACAHEVQHSTQAGSALIVQLKYADGQPFAFEAFEATPEGAETPARVGRTDAEGRAVFVPGTVKRWKFKAYSADGHGVMLDVETPATADAAISTDSEAPSRASLLLFGLSLLLGSFGLYQLFIKRKIS